MLFTGLGVVSLADSGHGVVHSLKTFGHTRRLALVELCLLQHWGFHTPILQDLCRNFYSRWALCDQEDLSVIGARELCLHTAASRLQTCLYNDRDCRHFIVVCVKCGVCFLVSVFILLFISPMIPLFSEGISNG